MIPSRTADSDENSTLHDAISVWLLRASRLPGAAEHLLSIATAAPVFRSACQFQDIELEALIWRGVRGDVKGIADALLHFSDGIRLWVEIKPDDRAIGALVRQVKMYRRFIVGQSGNWLAIMPKVSAGAREFLTHAGIGTLDLSVADARLPEFIAPPERTEDPYSAIPHG